MPNGKPNAMGSDAVVEAKSHEVAVFWHGDFPWRHEPGYGATTPVPRKVVKGGLQPRSVASVAGRSTCRPRRADSYCQRYRPAARRPQMIDTGMSHVGFRCVTRRVGTAPVGGVRAGASR